MLAGILGFLSALPKILDLISRLGKLIQDARTQEWINELEDAIHATEKASSPNDFKDAAKSLVNVIRGL